MNDRPIYRHVQSGVALRIFLWGVAAVITIVELSALAAVGSAATFGVVVGLVIGVGALVGSALIFTSLTIEVTQTDVLWWFGYGWPSGRIARGELTGATIAKPGLLNGIGIHLTLRGWLWNVSLGTAVELRRTFGPDVLLGTDDPGGLIAALALPDALDSDA